MADKRLWAIICRFTPDSGVALLRWICIGVVALHITCLIPCRANSLQTPGSPDGLSQLSQLYAEGYSAYQKSDSARAKDLFRQGYEMAKTLKSIEFQGKFAEQLSSVIYYEGDLTGAILVMNEGLELSRIGDHREAVARMRLQLAQYYGRKQDYASAQFQATQAAAVYIALHDENGAARARKTLADIDSNTGRYSSAISNLLAAKEIAPPPNCLVLGLGRTSKDR